MSIPTSEIKNDPIWYKDVKILFNLDRMIEFFPHKNSTIEENLNSLVRLSIYGSILIAMYKRNPTYLALIIVFLVITYVIHKYYDEKEHLTAVEAQKKIQFKQESPIESTINNPFMNPTFLDASKNRRPVPEYHQDTQEAEEMREKVSNNFNYGLYRDIEDVFGRKNSQRQFYTVPSTTIPNDQSKYRDFLFGDLKSCKDNTDDCSPYQDLRRNRPIMVNTEQEEE